MNRANQPSRDWLIGIAWATVVVDAMLLYALFGRPAYAFYGLLRWAIAIVAGLGCWVLLALSKRTLPIALCLGLVGLVHLFGKMRRHDWLLYDRAALILMIVLGVMLAPATRQRPGSTR